MGEQRAVSRSATIRAAPATTRPKIKIIHIIAPEIIKTDVANFRDLVQRLTGKAAACAGTAAADKLAAAPPPVQQQASKDQATKKRPPPAADDERSGFALQQEEPNKKRKIKCEVKVEEGGFGGDYCGDLVDRGDLWMDHNPGGFLSFLEDDDDDVLQGMMMPAADHDFLMQPFGSSRLDLVGEMYAS